MSPAASQPNAEPAARFRTRLLVAMMIVISAITGLSAYLAQRKIASDAESELQREFQGELARLHTALEVRHAALAERCRSLVRRPRIHAALEDNALDLLYPSAKDELRDLLASDEEDPAPYGLRARFYRFLDASGAVIAPPDSAEVGALRPDEETRLSPGGVPEQQQLGYLPRVADDGRETIDEVIAMPIISSETGEVIAALVVGFKPVELRAARNAAGLKSGLWIEGRLRMTALPPEHQVVVEKEISRAIADARDPSESSSLQVDGVPHLVFHRQLNPGARFPPACEVFLYPLEAALARERRVRAQILGAGAALLIAGGLASHFLSGRLSAPVEKLAVDSAEHRAQRRRAEAALEVTSQELQRSARFSADASHQLKTPVTVMRAGLEELLARSDHSPGEGEEIAALIHQTYRLGNIIEDLLLLSRMEAGRLKLDLRPVDLAQLIARWVDDMSALPDSLDLDVETDLPPGLRIFGEPRYTSLILQNLLENARKYNRPGGRIRVGARFEDDMLALVIGNTAPPIPRAVQEHIFERFHRGAVGENVPGYGLGLNLARELARLHGGDLHLARSDADWTEFEVCFRLARETAPAYGTA